jgi:tetratricopeptide (TPR) repeat protein
MNSHVRVTKKNILSSRFFVSASIAPLWRLLTSTTFISILSLTCSLPSSWAGDPFRTANPRNIGEKTELAFKALFEDGNYPLAKEYLIVAESQEQNDPMLTALRSALAYTEQDWQTMKDYATKTVKVAQEIANQDPLRSNLYLAVGNFLEGAYQFETDGPVAALNKLQLVFKYFDEAEKIDSNDPELNLIKGYLNLILAVNLPFSSPEQAIEKLQKYAYPQYLVNRGIALAYRDLDDYDLALVFVQKAIESTPINPELYYLKGQILRQKGQKENNITLLQEALKNFDLALARLGQLPAEGVGKPLQREKRKTLEKIDELTVSGNEVNVPSGGMQN